MVSFPARARPEMPIIVGLLDVCAIKGYYPLMPPLSTNELSFAVHAITNGLRELGLMAASGGYPRSILASKKATLLASVEALGSLIKRTKAEDFPDGFSG